MGIDFIIAGIIAAFIIFAKDAKQEHNFTELILQEAQAEKNYFNSLGRNLSRQNELRRMGLSSLRSEREKFAHILGRPCNNTEVAVERGVRAIAEKEGWFYFDENEIYYDPVYCRIVNIPQMPQSLVDDWKYREIERREKEKEWQLWAKRHPHCFELNISPEYYKSEDTFALVVNTEYRKWQLIKNTPTM